MPQGTKTNTRVSGFAVSVHGFIPVPKDLKEQIATLQAVEAATASGDMMKLIAMMEVDADGINHKPVNRMIPEDEWAAMQDRRAKAAAAAAVAATKTASEAGGGQSAASTATEAASKASRKAA